MSAGPRILVIDVETAPNLAHVWSLWNVNVGLPQLQESSRLLCFAAKWLGQRGMEFRSEHADGHEAMVRRAHELVDEADAIIHYNGVSFDMKHLHREFLLAGLDPPSPYKNIDLLKTVKQQFRFPSNKLDYVTQALGIGKKVRHQGHELWVRCLAGDDAAWRTMERYNRADVALTERAYKRLLPWIPGHPHHGLYNETDCCQRCGSEKLQRRGYAYSPLGVFQQFQCQGCGSWSRGGKRLFSVDKRAVQ